MRRSSVLLVGPAAALFSSSALSQSNTCPVAPTSGQTTQTTFFYDANGNATQICDPRSTSTAQISTSQIFDHLGRLTSVMEPAGVTGTQPTILTTYDGLDQVTQIQDPRSQKTSYLFDGVGNVTQIISPDSGTTVNQYYANGLLWMSTDARGARSTYTYDVLNRVVSIAYVNTITNATSPMTSFAYDGDGGTPAQYDVGRLTSINDESGSTRLYYDGFGHVIKRVQNTPGTISQTVQYGYGPSGNTTGKLTSLTYPSGNVASFAYDAAGRVSSITIKHTVSGAVVTEPLLSNIVYNPFGSAISWTWGNGTPYERTFDLDGRLLTMPLGGASTSNALIRTLNYDPASNVLSMTHTDSSGNASPATNATLAPDNLSRLVGYMQGSSSQSFQYDMTGNRTSLNSYTDTVAGTSNQITATTGPAPAKNNAYSAGYLTSDGSNSYTYSVRGRMSLANTTNYLYNGFGQRVYKNGPTSIVPTGINRYVYDEAGHLLGEYDTSGNAISETVYLGDTPIGVIRPS